MTIENTVGAESAVARAVQIVEDYLKASMIPDPVRARTYVASDVKITFTGGRRFTDPTEVAAFNAMRYRWVQKKFERTEAVACCTEDAVVVFNSGTLFGEWRDGQTFSDNRYIDRFVVRAGKIASMEVWNDSAEHLLARAGLATT